LALFGWRCLFSDHEHDSAERGAIQNSTNLAGAFDEHLSRSLSEIDRSLRIIRTLQARDPGRSNLADWLKSNRVLTNDVLQIALVDREANVRDGGVNAEEYLDRYKKLRRETARSAIQFYRLRERAAKAQAK